MAEHFQEKSAKISKEMGINVLQFFGLPYAETQVIESVHNYIAEKDQIVRKGAISAHEGEQVIYG